MASPFVLPGFPPKGTEPEGITLRREQPVQRLLVHDEDILTARMRNDIEGLVTPIAWALVPILILLWMRQFARKALATNA